MKTNLRLLFTLLFVVSVVALRAGTMNDIRVSGTVVSEGDPLPGVSVLVKGTGVGTITGIDGKYSINVPSDGTLVFSFIGLKSVEHKVGGRSVINVELVPDSKQLEEVMVVAYATAKKYSFTGAASTVKGDEIAKLQTSSVSRALERNRSRSAGKCRKRSAGYRCHNPYSRYRIHQCIQCTSLCSGRCAL